MGKGDKRTRRGKIFAGSYGKTRSRYKKEVFVPSAMPAEEKPKRQRKPVVTKAKPAEEVPVA